MRTVVVLALICCVARVLSRPAKAEESEAEEIDYEESAEGAGSDQIAREEDESPESVAEAQETDTADQGYQEDKQGDSKADDEILQAVDEDGSEDAEDASQDETSEEQPARPSRYGISAQNKQESQSKQNGKEECDDSLLASSLKAISQAKQRQFGKYFQNKGQLVEQKPVRNRQTKSERQNRKTLEHNKELEETEDSFPNSDNNAESQERDKNELNDNESAEPGIQADFQHYYNAMQTGNEEHMPDKSYENQYNTNRDRREVVDKTKNKQPNKPSIENEEAAIKSHVKKLSSKEFEELLASLSNDKRELLKKIMGDDPEFSFDGKNKREIIKKAGAAVTDDNGLLERQVDVKLQDDGGCGDNSVSNRPSTTTSNNKPAAETSDMTELAVTKSSTQSSLADLFKADITGNSDLVNVGKDKNDASVVDSLSNKDQANQNHPSTAKTEIKRQAKLTDISGMDSIDDQNAESEFDLGNEQNYMSPQEEEFSEVMDDDSGPHDDNANILKREAVDSDLSESMKSLEESFPNSNNYEDVDSYSDSNLAPLVRVKRKNTGKIKKRDVAIASESKVGYCPYRAENDDEDNDEGSEFDDDGFFDRTSNLARSNLKQNSQEDSPRDANASQMKRSHTKNNMNRSKVSAVESMEHDDMSIGSDTDGVISGVEGVDENLMFSSAARNKRSKEDSKVNEPVDEAQFNRSVCSDAENNEEINPGSDSDVAANFQDDAFGPPPKNNDGELVRFKRIRRLKQNPNHAVTSSGS